MHYRTLGCPARPTGPSHRLPLNPYIATLCNRVILQGHEDRMTHLIIGEERRTLKVLLAVANGAHLLTPKWLTASDEAVSGRLEGFGTVRTRANLWPANH